MVFFFYHGGNGAQGALVSVAVSAGLMLLQRGAPEHLVPLLTCGLVVAAVAAPAVLESLRTAALTRGANKVIGPPEGHMRGDSSGPARNSSGTRRKASSTGRDAWSAAKSPHGFSENPTFAKMWAN